MKTKDYIKQCRKDLGLTLEQVGKYVGVGKPTVQKWESGLISNIGRDKIAKLSEILKISPIDIIYDEIQTPHKIYVAGKTNPYESDKNLNIIIDCYNKMDTIGKNALVEQAEFLKSKHTKSKAKKEAG